MITAEGILLPWFAVFLLILALFACGLWLWNKGWEYRDKEGRLRNDRIPKMECQ